MAIKSPTDRDSGFTLLEMLAVVLVAGILMTVAAPSFLSLNKPLRDAVNQFTSHLNLIRSKAMASSQAYRIKPRYTNISQYPNPKNYPTPIGNQFIVQYASNCQVADGSGWNIASQFDLNLPDDAGITNDSSVTLLNPSQTIANANDLTWSICFDSRGIIYQTRSLILRDFQKNNRARLAKIELNKVGINNINTYDINNTLIPKSGDNIVY